METGYAAFAGLQIALVALGLLVSGVYVLKTEALSSKFIWNIARTVVVFLPLALSWFGLFSAMFFQDINLALPVVVGVCAVCLNFILDKAVFQWNTVSAVSKFFGGITSYFTSKPAVSTV
jgi:ribose/xylose/arabinose/galactoside ABC-type transport system permease subunit